MARLQASVPVGVMGGYVTASIFAKYAGHGFLFGTEFWRWPIYIEVCLITPFCFAFCCIPKSTFNLRLKALPDITTASIEDKTLLSVDEVSHM